MYTNFYLHARNSCKVCESLVVNISHKPYRMIVITTPVWIRLACRKKLSQTIQFIILSRSWNNVVANKSWFMVNMYFSVNLALGLAANDEVIVFFKWDRCLYIVKRIICFFSIIACDIYIYMLSVKESRFTRCWCIWSLASNHDERQWRTGVKQA